MVSSTIVRKILVLKPINVYASNQKRKLWKYQGILTLNNKLLPWSFLHCSTPCTVLHITFSSNQLCAHLERTWTHDKFWYCSSTNQTAVKCSESWASSQMKQKPWQKALVNPRPPAPEKTLCHFLFLCTVGAHEICLIQSEYGRRIKRHPILFVYVWTICIYIYIYVYIYIYMLYSDTHMYIYIYIYIL